MAQFEHGSSVEIDFLLLDLWSPGMEIFPIKTNTFWDKGGKKNEIWLYSN